MTDRERRQGNPDSRHAMRSGLNEEQQMTLCELERYGWELRFVRRPLFQEPLAVVVDGDRKAFSVLNPDGSLDDRPSIKLRTQAA